MSKNGKYIPTLYEKSNLIEEKIIYLVEICGILVVGKILQREKTVAFDTRISTYKMRKKAT